MAEAVEGAFDSRRILQPSLVRLTGTTSPKPGSFVEWQIVGIFRTINNSEQLGDVSRPKVVLPFSQNPLLETAVAVRTADNPDAVRKDVAATAGRWWWEA